MKAASEVPPTPNQGCLAYVVGITSREEMRCCFQVRTGFASSQGQLLQMIEFSQDKENSTDLEKTMFEGFRRHL